MTDANPAKAGPAVCNHRSPSASLCDFNRARSMCHRLVRALQQRCLNQFGCLDMYLRDTRQIQVAAAVPADMKVPLRRRPTPGEWPVRFLDATLLCGQTRTTIRARHFAALIGRLWAGGEERPYREGVYSPGALQGYLIDKKTAEAHGITRIGQFKAPAVARPFDARRLQLRLPGQHAAHCRQPGEIRRLGRRALKAAE